MSGPMNCYRVAKEERREFYCNGQAPLIQDELDNIKSLNDHVSTQDVWGIYMPLAHLMYLCVREFKSLFLSKDLLLHKHVEVPPSIIGVTGSVIIGKSTIARLLQTILSYTFKRRNVQLIAIDGFPYPNRTLKERGIMDHKGLLESYDMEMLIGFSNRVKSGQEEIKISVYSHDVYDIIPDKCGLIQQSNALIVEGISMLQLSVNQRIHVSDSFNFSAYVDADPVLIERWYLNHFDALLDTASQNPEDYYYRLTIGDREEVFKVTKDVWKNVNLKSLQGYILSTRGRAGVILHKTENHIIDSIFMRKY